MNICVFCGSSHGADLAFTQAAKVLAKLICDSNSTLVYGGGNIGLMGVLADEILADQGKVIGVIPDFLMRKEVGHTGITQLEIVSTMHERKKRMAELADVFVAIPGGWGTLDEFAEILTWRQLGLINQPIGLLNISGFFDHLILQMKHMAEMKFLPSANLAQIKISDDPKKLLTALGVKLN
ncbi:MAG TPA: TIGR00730 family Rossman fold protein [Cytophagales bacterium]|jgi:uncharacterized protein (TIGR00730 family)|nr:TIGR00730 family Rossman fold protein [Cytophagales bacterium]